MVAVYTNRERKIDAAVMSACELLSALQQLGDVNEAQTQFVIHAVARASVKDLKDWEIKEACKRIAKDFDRMETINEQVKSR
jgi:hypothetical protein